MSAKSSKKNKTPRRCASCQMVGLRTTGDYLIRCTECNKSWHGRDCLYQPLSSEEVTSRNHNQYRGYESFCWRDWKCRLCRGEGPEGADYRPRTKNSRHQQSARPTPANLTTSSRPSNAPTILTKPTVVDLTTSPLRSIAVDLTTPPRPAAVDLTMESDSDPEVIIVDSPASRPSPPILNLHLHQPLQDDAISIRSSPVPMEISNADDPGDNPLQYLPTPELEYMPTPELRYPSELPARDLRSPAPDIGNMYIETPAEPKWPVFPFPEPTSSESSLDPPDTPASLRKKPLPPCLRPSQASILGEYLGNAATDSPVVKIIQLEVLKAAGWAVKEESQEVVLQPRSTNKGKQRAFGERTRDWTPLVQREQIAQVAGQHHTSATPPSTEKQIISRLVPPLAETYNGHQVPKPYPPRQPRKRFAKARAPTVKLEERVWSLE